MKRILQIYEYIVDFFSTYATTSDFGIKTLLIGESLSIKWEERVSIKLLYMRHMLNQVGSWVLNNYFFIVRYFV